MTYLNVMLQAVMRYADWIRAKMTTWMQAAHARIPAHNYEIISVFFRFVFRPLAKILHTFIMTAHQLPTWPRRAEHS
jgi:hypothetical protein